jgi:ketosteroid isomerase-like protein
LPGVARKHLETLVRSFFDAYGLGERERAASFLAEDLTAFITNGDAGVDEVRSRDEYMARVPDLRAAGGSLHVTQVVAVDDERVLSMVEIRAARSEKVLHNFAGFLARVRHDQIVELWMVDARPAYSDEFWS